MTDWQALAWQIKGASGKGRSEARSVRKEKRADPISDQPHKVTETTEQLE
ncbi:MAG: hypothetical protein JWQ87_3820 [Candidatus Sulfotelmatobacter sp.]|nr:hypothetical protein [Candidatus Sulfotelmatobacter sp.]